MEWLLKVTNRFTLITILTLFAFTVGNKAIYEFIVVVGSLTLIGFMWGVEFQRWKSAEDML